MFELSASQRHRSPKTSVFSMQQQFQLTLELPGCMVCKLTGYVYLKKEGQLYNNGVANMNNSLLIYADASSFVHGLFGVALDQYHAV